MDSQNGYSVLDSLADCIWYEISKSANVYIPMRKGAPGYVLAQVAKRFHESVESLNRTDCHGYNRRRISGSDQWSNHASATAADLNATRHSYGRVNTFTGAQVTEIENILEDMDGTVRWGGHYRYTKDEMHFEIDKPLADVRLVARRLKRNNTVSLRRLQPGKRNIDVYMVKRALSKKDFAFGSMTLYFGKAFQRGYSDWQKSLGYTGSDADGVPGRASLEALGFKVKD